MAMKNHIAHVRVLLNEVEMHMVEMFQDAEYGVVAQELKELADETATLREKVARFALKYISII